MNDLEKMRAWLLSYPKWSGILYTDYIDATPGNAGLYLKGLQMLEERQDVLGCRQVKNRYTFLLRRTVSGQEDAAGQAEWLLEFQKWTQEQNAGGNTPVFGDVPQKETIRAEKGKLEKASQVGCGLYVVTVTAEFIKIYEE